MFSTTAPKGPSPRGRRMPMASVVRPWCAVMRTCSSTSAPPGRSTSAPAIQQRSSDHGGKAQAHAPIVGVIELRQA